MQYGLVYDYSERLCICTLAVNPHFTGKERDQESGNDYFGARYYASTMGRFLSPDPSRLSILFSNPQTWNRYAYVYNNPLGIKDDNGKWPTYIHEQIIDRAFPNLTPAQRQILKNVSRAQDGLLNGGQSKSLAFEHAMRAPGQSVDDAQSKFDNFVDTKEFSADLRMWLSDDPSTLDPHSLEEFAEALHALVDQTSPAHMGFQVWDYDPRHIAAHMQNESTIRPDELQNAVNVARRAFNQTFGSFGFFISEDHSSVTTVQGQGVVCGKGTGNSCP
jgi:RHS repeat-associated protein